MTTKVNIILRTSRDELKAALAKVVLPQISLQVIRAPSSEACIEEVIKDDQAFLVLDWLIGSSEVNQILGAMRRHYKVEVRSILLIIDSIEANVVATAMEYGVSQVHSGPLEETTLGGCLAIMIREAFHENPIRNVLLETAMARQQGNWEIVTSMLADLHQKNPDNGRIAAELAENYIFERQWDKAIVILEPFAHGEIPQLRALHLLGRAYLGRGEADKALEVLKKAKLFNPENVDRLIDIGHIYMVQDRPEEAKSEFEMALAIDPAATEAQKGQGQAMLMMGEVNEALTVLKQISGPREMASIFNTAAIISVKHQHFDKGKELYHSALKALGGDKTIAARLFYNLGLAYRKWQKPEKALAAFAKSSELDPSFEKVKKLLSVLSAGSSGVNIIKTEHEAAPGSDRLDFQPQSKPVSPEGDLSKTDEFSEEHVQSKGRQNAEKQPTGVGSQKIDQDETVDETVITEEEEDWSPIDPAA